MSFSLSAHGIKKISASNNNAVSHITIGFQGDDFTNSGSVTLYIEDDVLNNRLIEAINKVVADRKAEIEGTHVPALEILEPSTREAGAILVCDKDRNDIAEFYHNEHATVGQSYETALALAQKLVAAS